MLERLCRKEPIDLDIKSDDFEITRPEARLKEFSYERKLVTKIGQDRLYHCD